MKGATSVAYVVGAAGFLIISISVMLVVGLIMRLPFGPANGSHAGINFLDWRDWHNWPGFVLGIWAGIHSFRASLRKAPLEMSGWNRQDIVRSEENFDRFEWTPAKEEALKVISTEPPPPELVQVVERETQGHFVLWSGRPAPWGYARRSLAVATFGLLFTAFSAVFFRDVWSGRSDVCVGIVGALFLLNGLNMLLTPAIDSWRSRHTFYVVTNRCAFIFERFWKLKVHAFSAQALQGFERISRRSPEGDLLFERTVGRRGAVPRQTGFFGLRNFADVERALNILIRGQR